ncbi:MAG: hypothetical protein FDW93_06775 [Bergeyella sp.]|nr:hypothetical protein [Bergeyella sp.]
MANTTRTFMRLSHRYLGYFMAGIMTLYALSGIILLYRDTDLFKREKHYNTFIDKNLTEKKLARSLKIKGFEITKNKKDILYFKQGYYNTKTGQTVYTKMELPLVLNKIARLHTTKSADPWSPLVIIFGGALFFFVISSFWMFNPKSKPFKRGILVLIFGVIFALVLTLLS